jgi:hypothetical protein
MAMTTAIADEFSASGDACYRTRGADAQSSGIDSAVKPRRINIKLEYLYIQIDIRISNYILCCLLFRLSGMSCDDGCLLA